MAMDSQFARPRRSRGIALIAAISLSGLASVGLTAASASVTTAAFPCTTRQESTPFAKWNDAHSYFLMPNGGFEAGATSWALSGGAAVVSGNESSFANRAGDSHSLNIPMGARATSQTICVGRAETSFRLFVKSPNVTTAKLHVEVDVQDPQTGRVVQTGFNVNASALGSGWSPTIRMNTPNPGNAGTGTQNLTLVFSATGSPGTWSIDDVFVDPFRLR